MAPLKLIPDLGALALSNKLAMGGNPAKPRITELFKNPGDCQEVRNGRLPSRCSVATPSPLPRTSDHLRANRIEHNVPGELKQMAVSLDEDRLETPLEDMPCSFHLAILPLCVNPVQITHTSRKIRVGCLNQQVIMVRH